MPTIIAASPRRATGAASARFSGPPKIAVEAERAATSGSAQARIAAAGRRRRSEVAAKPKHPQGREDQHRGHDRQAAALSGRARLAERGEADQPGGESVERAGQAVGQFGAQLPRHSTRLVVIRR